MAAYYARDYRDAVTRLARFKQLCTREELQIRIGKDECLIEPVWQQAQEETPPLLTDAAFASFVELGRRGTGHPVNPKKVELKRKAAGIIPNTSLKALRDHKLCRFNPPPSER